MSRLAVRTSLLPAVALACCVAASARAGASTWAHDYPDGYAEAATMTSDRGYAVAGVGRLAVAITKFDAAGVMEWKTDLGTPLAVNLWGIAEMGDGFLAVGAIENDGWAVKVDLAGSLVWQRRYHSGVVSFFDDVVPAADGGAYVSGKIELGADFSYFALMRLEESGDIRWVTAYRHYELGISTGGLARGAVAATPDGGVVGGTMISRFVNGNEEHDAGLVALNADGTLAWQRAYGVAGATEFTYGLSLGSDGTIFAAVYEYDAPGLGTLLRLAPDRTLAWNRAFGPGPGENIHAAAVAATDDGGCVAAGREFVPVWQTGWTWRLTAAGDTVWQHFVPDLAFTAVAVDPLGGVFVAGVPQVFIAHLDDDGLARSSCWPGAPATLPMISLPMIEWTPNYPVVSAVLAVTDTTCTVSYGLDLPTCVQVDCPTLSCQAITVEPSPPCASASVRLSLRTTGGAAPVTVEWDLDDNGSFETLGNDVIVSFPAGSVRIAARASDACPDGAQRCGTSTIIQVARPVSEVSDVLGGARPLLVTKALVTAELRPEATSYNVHAGIIGSWWHPAPLDDVTCGVRWQDLGGAVVEIAVQPAVDTWLLVTAANACGEGPAGRTSLGLARESLPAWVACP